MFQLIIYLVCQMIFKIYRNKNEHNKNRTVKPMLYLVKKNDLTKWVQLCII